MSTEHSSNSIPFNVIFYNPETISTSFILELSQVSSCALHAVSTWKLTSSKWVSTVWGPSWSRLSGMLGRYVRNPPAYNCLRQISHKVLLHQRLLYTFLWMLSSQFQNAWHFEASKIASNKNAWHGFCSCTAPHGTAPGLL